MAPFLRDEGPPVSPTTIQRARDTLAHEYGWQKLNETGRIVLMVRVPKAKPDYLHDLTDVAFYVSEEDLGDAQDVLLVGDEKSARLEPRQLRDCIRTQGREDTQVVGNVRNRLDRMYGQTYLQSPSNFQHQAVVLRIPKSMVAEFGTDDVTALRHVLQNGGDRIAKCQYGYIIADKDHERLGRRVLQELAGTAPESPAEAPPMPHDAEDTSAFAPSESAHVETPLAHLPASAAHADLMVDENEEYEIVTRPKTAPATPARAPSPPPVETPMGNDDENETEIFAPKPPAVNASAPTAAPKAMRPRDILTPSPHAEVVNDEYEIIGRPKTPKAPQPTAAPTAAPAPVKTAPKAPTVPQPPAASPLHPAPLHPAPAFHVDPDEVDDHVVHDEYEIITSKPRAIVDAPAVPAPPPAKTREYEILGRAAAMPPVAQPAPAVPRDDPRLAPARAQPLARAAQAPTTPLALPAADNGEPLVAHVTQTNPEKILAHRLRDLGYELVEGVKARGQDFAFAAHKTAGGRRLLVQRVPELTPDAANALAPLVVALGADVGIVIADRIAPGVRLATWGTRLEVVLAVDVPTLDL